MDPGSYVGEVVKVMGKTKVLVKVSVQKYSTNKKNSKNNLENSQKIKKRFTKKENMLLILIKALISQK